MKGKCEGDAAMLCFFTRRLMGAQHSSVRARCVLCVGGSSIN